MSEDIAYEMPWRSNYEAMAIAGWCAASATAFGVGQITEMPTEPFYWMNGICGVMALARIPKAIKLHTLKKHLSGRDLEFIDFDGLMKKIKGSPEEMWLGTGFTWENRHAQRAFEILKRDWSQVASPEGDFDKLYNKISSQRKQAPIGHTWIHGVEPKEKTLLQPLKHSESHTLIVGTTGSGKAQPLDACVHTPDGWRLMGDIQQGDLVTIPSGGAATVAGVYPQGRKAVFDVILADGRSTEACREHLWAVYGKCGDEAEVIDTHRLRKRTDAGAACFLPLTEAVEQPAVATALTPYLVGSLMVQGPCVSRYGRNMQPNQDDFKIIADMSMLAWRDGAEERRIKEASHLLALHPSDMWPLEAAQPILQGSIAQRTALLSGLLDAAGYIQGEALWVTCRDEEAVTLIQELVWSLGGAAYAPLAEGDTSLVRIQHPRLHHFVTAPYLQQALAALPLDASLFSPRIQVNMILYARTTQAQCLYIDHPDHLYVTDDFIVTHNTRMFDLLISQAIARGECVIILDPKGDKEMRDNARRACEKLGTPERFVSFHPGFPAESARINPLRNFTRITEIASRIAALIPSEAGADPFKSFGWQALNNIAQGLYIVNERPTLKNLRSYLEGGAEGLVIEAMAAYSEKHLEDWQTQARPYLEKAEGGTRTKRARMLCHFYYEVVQKQCPSSELEGLLSMFQHDAAHFGKMVASLLPILNMLTSGDLGSLLSPDPYDMSDDRPITDSDKIINNAMVAYIGLDSLTDGMVASAIGSIFLSDLTAVAGKRYNYGTNLKQINIFVDEAAECINDPMIMLLNKGRGALFRLFVATQTYADFVARLGSQEKALQVLGNINNTIALRIKDTETQEYVTKGLPMTRVKYVMRTQGQNTVADQPIMHGGNQGERLMEEESELFPAALLGMLPNLEFVANISGGHFVKGRIPILIG